MLKYFVISIVFHIFVINLVKAQSKGDIKLLSSLITSECSVCSQQEQIFVGATVIQRMNEWDMTLEEVIFDEDQYAGTLTKNFIETKKATAVAKYLLNPRSTIPYVLYFTTKTIRNNSFAKTLEIKFEGDYHYFYTEDKLSNKNNIK